MDNLSGLLGLPILAGDIYAIVKIIQSSVTTTSKVLWMLGLIIWFVTGPRGNS